MGAISFFLCFFFSFSFSKVFGFFVILSQLKGRVFWKRKGMFLGILKVAVSENVTGTKIALRQRREVSDMHVERQ